MTTSAPAATTSLSSSLRTLYIVRVAFTLVWVALLFATGGSAGPFLTVLLIAYPLFDAGAVLWQLRARPDADRSATSEWINVVVSVLVAIALGVASTVSLAAALAIWGAWAIGAGIPQLISAIRNRRSGGQVPQMLSGGISVFAGSAFLFQGIQGSEMIVGVGGYAAIGAVFFAVSAIRLSILLRREAR
ncbi:MAG: hypothetical protein P0Y60_01810 [Candidatus Microbacterium colombiense]|nr:MAG: hypothetical protein P0Y60_01810 [Microbacterium sp.]